MSKISWSHVLLMLAARRRKLLSPCLIAGSIWLITLWEQGTKNQTKKVFASFDSLFHYVLGSLVPGVGFLAKNMVSSELG